MAHTVIYIDLIHNCLRSDSGQIHHFARRLSALFMLSLWQAAQQKTWLNFAQFQQLAISQGRQSRIHRSQIVRILADVRAQLAQAAPKVRIDTTTAKGTTGPWQLYCPNNVVFQASSAAPVLPDIHTPEKSDMPGSYVRILAAQVGTAERVGQLLGLLQLMLKSDVLAKESQFADAAELLKRSSSFDVSLDMQCLIWLRQARHLKAIGMFDAAAELLKSIVSQRDKLHFEALPVIASLLLQRIQYDKAPAAHYVALSKTLLCPAKQWQTDTIIMFEWHNLKALILRRQILAEFERQQTITTALFSWHDQVFQHTEAALFCALWDSNFETVQSILANFAFYLTKMLPLGLSDLGQTFDLYNMFMNYSEEADVGKNSAWEFIMFGEFWLDYQQPLLALCKRRPFMTLTIIENQHPGNEAFYLRGLEKLKACADARQVALGYINYLRFARQNLSAAKVADIEHELQAWVAQTPELVDVLCQSGYEAYLPVILRQQRQG